jgi:hypothetical protein
MRGIWFLTIRRLLIAALAALVSAGALTACGGSGKGGGSGGTAVASGIRFADCMRAHGVPNFPDPSSGGGIQIPDGVNPQSPAFQAAQSSCSKLMPGGGPLRGHSSESRKLALLHLAQCMRRHGITSFPDPVASPPAPRGGLGVAFGSPGAFIAVSQSMLDSPGFQQAAQACGFPGGGRVGTAKRSLTPG